MFAKKMDDISGVENDEPNTIELLVDGSMTREDVVDKIKQKLEEIRFWVKNKQKLLKLPQPTLIFVS